MNLYEFLFKESTDDPFKSIDEQLESLDGDLNEPAPANNSEPNNKEVNEDGERKGDDTEGQKSTGDNTDVNTDNGNGVGDNTDTGLSDDESTGDGQVSSDNNGEGDNGVTGGSTGVEGENGENGEGGAEEGSEENYFDNELNQDLMDGNTTDDLDPEVMKRAHLRLNGQFKDMYDQYDTIYDKLSALDLKEETKKSVDPIIEEYGKLTSLLKTYVANTKDPFPVKIKRFCDIRMLFAIQNKNLAVALGYNFMDHIRNNVKKKGKKRV